MTSPAIQAADKAQKASQQQVEVLFRFYINDKNNRIFIYQLLASTTPQARLRGGAPSFGFFTWIRIFRFADSLMRQGC